jgi:predicted dehydrogenase
MTQITRRAFLGTSLATLPAVAQALQGAKAGPNERLRIATVGVRGQGGAHVRLWAGMKDVEVAAICDIDETVIAEAMKKVEEKNGKKPTYYQDFRKLLEDKSIDAISIATCNHTHTLIALSAVQAGKDVYVEKPLSHTLWEGRKLVEAARKYNRLVQHGTQSRSDGRRKQAVEYMRTGKLGKVKVARGLCYKRRESIGKKPDGPVPPGVDYNLWLGPAPERAFNPNRFHYNWHWNWDYGNGDIGNQGIHEMDVARWGLGKPGLPRKVVCIGGRFGYEDDGLTPNTQIALFDYGDSVLIFEVRGLPTDEYKGALIGDVFHGEKGIISAGGKGVSAIDAKGEEITKFSWEGSVDHFRNFVDCVRSRKQADLSADVQEGRLSCSLVHMANISYRLGEARPMSKDDPFGPYEDGNETFRRFRDHLRESGVPLDQTPVRVGRTLEFDPATETFIGDADANAMLRRDYRKPFVVPENV